MSLQRQRKDVEDRLLHIEYMRLLHDDDPFELRHAEIEIGDRLRKLEHAIALEWRGR